MGAGPLVGACGVDSGEPVLAPFGGSLGLSLRGLKKEQALMGAGAVGICGRKCQDGSVAHQSQKPS